jgi:hypothetical protein
MVAELAASEARAIADSTNGRAAGLTSSFMRRRSYKRRSPAHAVACWGVAKW